MRSGRRGRAAYKEFHIPNDGINAEERYSQSNLLVKAGISRPVVPQPEGLALSWTPMI